jgi:hypothetical protein
MISRKPVLRRISIFLTPVMKNVPGALLASYYPHGTKSLTSGTAE